MTAYSSSNKIARIISVVSGLLFWIFSLAYLAVLQGDLLSFKLNGLLGLPVWKGEEWIVALLLTGVLYVLNIGIKHYVAGNLAVISYLPSYLILGLLTFDSQYWHPWLFLIGLAVVILSFFFQNSKEDLNTCLLRTVLFCLLTISIGNTNEAYLKNISANLSYLRQ